MEYHHHFQQLPMGTPSTSSQMTLVLNFQLLYIFNCVCNKVDIFLSMDDFIDHLQVCKKFGKIVGIGQQNDFL